MLHADPTLRPSVSDLLADEFFTSGYAPLRLPTSCLTVPPRFSIAPSSLDPALLRKPLSSLNKGMCADKQINMLCCSVLVRLFTVFKWLC